MRVIAGTYRSRPLAAPRGLSTRPTSDRLRETLFNVIAQRITGSRFADLYAGSGAVGIEAISRGAAEVLFAEKSPSAVAAIRGNLRALTIGTGFQIEAAGVSTLLKRQSGKPMDIVFLDPPYEDVEEYRKTLTSLGDPAEELVGADSLVIAEHERRQPLADRYGVLRRTRTLLQGDVALSFYVVEAEEPEPLPDLVE
jgi:16S rRNA (guanine966-N2)-methyltransferase